MGGEVALDNHQSQMAGIQDSAVNRALYYSTPFWLTGPVNIFVIHYGVYSALNDISQRTCL